MVDQFSVSMLELFVYTVTPLSTQYIYIYIYLIKAYLFTPIRCTIVVCPVSEKHWEIQRRRVLEGLFDNIILVQA